MTVLDEFLKNMTARARAHFISATVVDKTVVDKTVCTCVCDCACVYPHESIDIFECMHMDTYMLI